MQRAEQFVVMRRKPAEVSSRLSHFIFFIGSSRLSRFPTDDILPLRLFTGIRYQLPRDSHPLGEIVEAQAD